MAKGMFFCLRRVVAEAPDAYTYLQSSTEQFLLAEDLLQHMWAAGLRKVRFQRLLLGTVPVYWGTK